MLSQKYPTLQLVSKNDWHPYPTAQERASWQALPDSVRRYYLLRGEQALDYDWPSMLATRFLEYARVGNRINYETVNFERRSKLVDLVLAECIEGEGRFIDQAVNGLWLICEETYWGIPAHIGVQKAGRGLPDAFEPTVDLFAAETAALLAYALYLLGDQLDAVSPLIRPRIEQEIDRRILTPNLERDDFGWMGFATPDHRPNNWNPWINTNWLACVLLVEEDDERRRQSVAKIMRSLDMFIDPYPQDGGCDEGPSYWGRAAASMFEGLELLYEATNGQVDVFDEPLVQNMGQFVYRTHIADDYYVNFADAPAVVVPDASLVFRYGQRINDADMQTMGAWLAHRQQLFTPAQSERPVDGRPASSIMRQLPRLFHLQDMAAAEARAPLPRDVWLPVIEVMTARDEAGSTDGFYVAAKGGHNAESHNHNDIGQFIVYIDGLPVLVDAGVGIYSEKTFSPRRYEIWTMQSGYHNLPTINGVDQAPGVQYAARDADYSSDDSAAQLSLDIATAYPTEAGLETWRRTVRLERGQAVIVNDDYALAHPPDSLTMSFITPCRVDVATSGEIRLDTARINPERETGAAVITYGGDKFSASVETIIIDDARLGGSWGAQLYRIVLTATAPAQRDHWQWHIRRL